jgi:hypothetical protein
MVCQIVAEFLFIKKYELNYIEYVLLQRRLFLEFVAQLGEATGD